MKKEWLSIILLWFFWAVILFTFQRLVLKRMILKPPDTSLGWTVSETMLHSQDDKIYLKEPFLNEHVSWDSEFYISIALSGYDDPAVRGVPGRIKPGGESRISLNYAFFPFYPLMIRLLRFPVEFLTGLKPIPSAILSGVIVSLLGMLAGMFAIYYIARLGGGEENAWRAIFYLMVFPSSFFMGQVYSEGLFVGLSFSSLALLGYRKYFLSAILSVMAVLTRAAGVFLFIPIFMTIVMETDWSSLKKVKVFFKWLLRILFGVAPVIAFLLWKFSILGKGFEIVENAFFGRGLFQIHSIYLWMDAFKALFKGGNPQTFVYYAMEFSAIFLGFASALFMYKDYPEISVFSFMLLVVSMTSGAAQGMIRYVLTAPSVFLFLSKLGRNKVFDKTWTLISTLLLGLLTTLFSFDFWVG